MAKRHILCDKTEIILGYRDGNKYKTANLAYDTVSRISFDPCTESKFFRKVPSEKITIVTKKVEKPIVYTKLKHQDFFEDYKKELETFAKDNRVTFYNNLEK